MGVLVYLMTKPKVTTDIIHKDFTRLSLCCHHFQVCLKGSKELNKSKGDPTMNLKPLGANRNEISTNDKEILVSYQTPVAYYDKRTHKAYKTNKSWSRTTSKHISLWIGSYQDVSEVDQSVLDSILDGVK
jgi:hypothetical protein